MDSVNASQQTHDTPNAIDYILANLSIVANFSFYNNVCILNGVSQYGSDRPHVIDTILAKLSILAASSLYTICSTLACLTPVMGDITINSH